VQWADALPSLLIGLSAGLGAGLVVSIMLAALRETAASGQRISPAPLWLGVLGALIASGSFAAVLIFAVPVLSSRAQEAAVGLLNVVAAALVTAMILRMRRTAPSRSVHLRAEIAASAAIGAGALTLTAFLMLIREGLVTTLFIWAAAKAPASPAAPLAGAGLGLAAGVALCWLSRRPVTAPDLGTFLRRAGAGLIVIAGGVLAYGLGDGQQAGWLPGQWWVAFDLNAHSWWVSLISGVTELAPRMTVLQVFAWVAVLAVVLPVFVPGRGAAVSPGAQAGPAAGRWQRIAARRGWLVAGGVLGPGDRGAARRSGRSVSDQRDRDQP
jgi:high-affinity iron transporter